MSQGSLREVVPSRALVGVVCALVLTACGSSGPSAAPAPAGSFPTSSPSAEPTESPAEVTGMPVGVQAEVADESPGVENGDNLTFVSPVYTLAPAGPLTDPVTVRMRLDNAVPTRTRLLVAARTSSDAPWTYAPGRLTADHQHVEYTTRSLDQVGVLAIEHEGALSSLKDDVRSGLTSDVDRTVERPTCTDVDAARKDGYTVASNKSKTLFWCFGLEKDKRVVKVVNRRLAPVQVLHPDVSVVEAPGTAKGYAAWPGVLGTENAFLAPGRSATFDAELDPDAELSLTSGSGREGLSLRLLQATARALALRIEAFGAGTVNVPKTVSALLARPQCAKTLGTTSDAMVASCLSKRRLVKIFGSRALLVAPLVAAPSFSVFLDKQAATMLKDETDVVQRITVRRAAPDFTGFVGLWGGPYRLLTIDKQGVATEKVTDGTDLIIKLTYQLEESPAKGKGPAKPAPKGGTSSVKATITSVKVANPKLVNGRAPRVGDTGNVTVSKGVLTPPYLGKNYCDPAATKKGACGQ